MPGSPCPSPAGQAAAVAEALAVAEVAPERGPLRRGARQRHPARRRDRGGRAQRGVRGRARPSRCALGSVKTNIGHLDAAAGIAGLIKAVLAVQHRRHPAEPALQPAAPGGRPGRRPVLRADQGARLAERASAGSPGSARSAWAAPTCTCSSAEAPRPNRSAEDDGRSCWRCPRGPGPRCGPAATRLRDHLAAHRPALADVAHTLATGRRAFRLPRRRRGGARSTRRWPRSTRSRPARSPGPVRCARPHSTGWTARPSYRRHRRAAHPAARPIPFQRDRYWIEPTRRGEQAVNWFVCPPAAARRGGAAVLPALRGRRRERVPPVAGGDRPGRRGARRAAARPGEPDRRGPRLRPRRHRRRDRGAAPTARTRSTATRSAAGYAFEIVRAPAPHRRHAAGDALRRRLPRAAHPRVRPVRRTVHSWTTTSCCAGSPRAAGCPRRCSPSRSWSSCCCRCCARTSGSWTTTCSPRASRCRCRSWRSPAARTARCRSPTSRRGSGTPAPG